MSRQELARWLGFLALAALVGWAWGNSLDGAFTYDDKVEVIGNRTIRFLEQWRLILSYNWSRPITLLSYALNFHLHRFDPRGYHVVDVALHALCAGQAMLLSAAVAEARGLARPLRFGVLAAALWALHPLTTEAVSYVTGRSEQLCALFYLMGCWAWLRWRLGGGPPHLALAVLAPALGLLSKEVAFTMPLAYALLDALAVGGGQPGALRARRYLPWALALLAFIVLRSLALVGEGSEAAAGGPYERLVHAMTGRGPLRPLHVQVLTQAEVLWRYLGLTLWPRGQSIFHDHPEAAPGLRPALALAAWLVSLGLAARGRSRAPLAALGLGWFVLVLMPSSSLIPLKETMAEHRALLSILGVAWGVAAGLERLPARAGAALGLGLALLLGSLTRLRNEVWAEEVSIWAEATRVNPASAEAWYGLGDALRLAGRPGEAGRAYERSVALNPELDDARVNLGVVAAMGGDDEGAERVWRELLARRPSSCKAHNNLGLLYARRGRPLEAGAEFRATLAWCPNDCRAHRYLGQLYAEALDDRPKAILHLETFLELCPDDSMSDEARALRDRLTW